MFWRAISTDNIINKAYLGRTLTQIGEVAEVYPK